MRAGVDVVGERVRRDPRGGECVRHPRVALAHRRVLVVVVEHRGRAGMHGHRAQFGRKIAFAQRKVRAERAQLLAERGECAEEELHDRRADARPAQELRIEHERAGNPLAALRCFEERDVIVEPQVAPQPDDAVRVPLVHRAAFGGSGTPPAGTSAA